MMTKICVLLVLMIAALVLMLSTASAAERKVTFTFDKPSYKLGDEITVNYKFVEGGPNWSTVYYYYTRVNGSWKMSDVFMGLEKEGTIKYTPTEGDMTYVVIDFGTPMGSTVSETYKSQEIPLESKVVVDFKLDKGTYELGKEIVVPYTVKWGEGTYTKIEYEIIIHYGKYYKRIVGELDTKNGNGTIKFTPKIGTDFRVEAYKYDNDGKRFYTATSTIYTLTGTPEFAPYTITADFRTDYKRETVFELGTEIEASVSVKGEDKYERIEYSVYVLKDDKRIELKSEKPGYSTFTTKFTPSEGDKAFIECRMYMYDGSCQKVESQTIDLIPPISVVTTFDGDKFYANGEITAHFTISGGSGTYTSIKYSAINTNDFGYNFGGVYGSIDTSARNGVIKFTPSYAIYAVIIYTITDAKGLEKTIYSDKIEVNENPITTKFYGDLYLHNEKKITYQISEEMGAISKGTYTCYTIDENGNSTEASSGNLDVTERAGTILYTPHTGEKEYVQYIIWDSNGRSIKISSQTCTLKPKPFAVKTTYNKVRYIYGEEVTATYEISGGTEIYTSGTYKCYVMDKTGALTEIASGNLDISKKTGTIKFTPENGQKFYITYTVNDSEGSKIDTKSETVSLIIKPVEIKTTFDKSSYAVGTEITANWQIEEGSGPFTRIEYTCVYVDDYSYTRVSCGEMDTSKRNGTIRFTPTRGEYAAIYYTVYNSDYDTFYNVNGSDVELTGGSASSHDYEEFYVYSEADVNAYNLGSEISYKYGFLYEDKMPYVKGEYECYIVNEDYSFSKTTWSGSIDLTKANGVIKFKPSTGRKAFVRFTMYRADGSTKTFDSETVDLIGTSEYPNNPITPINPTNPTNPTNPSNTTKPTNTPKPANPSNTTKPTDTSKPANPSNTTNPTNTAKPTNPSNTTKPTETSKPANPSNTTKPTNTSKPTNPSNTTKPTNTPKPANPSNTTNPTNTPKPANPSNTTKPTNTAKPANPSNTAKPSTPAEPKDKVEAYVFRCYKVILGRLPDAGGLKTWYNELTSGRKTASEIIDRFVNSPEYLNKHYNNGESVDILYQAMLGRNADAGGKANWVKKLENGQTLAHVINGFCFSKEFRSLCDSYGIKAGFVNIPITDTTAEGKIKAFVQRCYRIILDREADPSGMQTWYEQLSSGKKAAAEIIDRFVNSPEFSGKNYSHSDSVEILYKAMLGRGSDAAGKANWVGKLDAGQPFAVVINGFCVSKEFTGICASYGIKPGSVNVHLSGMAEEEALSMLAYKAKTPITKKSETNPTRVEIINPSDTIDMNIGTAVQAVYINEEKAKEFISRCYRCILGREASAAELENWIGQMTNGTKTPDQIARGFLFSNEFKGRNVGNEDLVKILYKVYMNREADPEGLKTWTEKLNGGMSLQALLDTFAKTNEFKAIVKKMGE